MVRDGGEDHEEGALDQGVRAAAVDWLPVPPGALAAHACRQVFAARGPLHPLSGAGRYVFRPHECESRADALRVPVLDAGTVLPPVPQHARAVPAPFGRYRPSWPRQMASTATRRGAGGRRDDGSGSEGHPSSRRRGVGTHDPWQRLARAVHAAWTSPAARAGGGEVDLHAERQPDGMMLRMTGVATASRSCSTGRRAGTWAASSLRAGESGEPGRDVPPLRSEAACMGNGLPPGPGDLGGGPFVVLDVRCGQRRSTWAWAQARSTTPTATRFRSAPAARLSSSCAARRGRSKTRSTPSAPEPERLRRVEEAGRHEFPLCRHQ